MIIVTGATGQLGGGVVQHLLRRVAVGAVGVSVRDPDKAAGLAERGVRVCRGDFDDPGSLQHAFEGASVVFVVSSNARASGGDTLAQHRNAIRAAKAAGAQRVVYTSHMGAGAGSAFPPMWDHAATEAMLADAGVAWTALRNGFYAKSGLMLLGDGLETGVVAAPEDGKVSWTAHDDLAEADAVILAAIASGDGERFDGPTQPLTGAEALDLGDIAAIASDVLGKPVRRETITEDQLRGRMAGHGAPAAAAEMVLGLYAGMRNGEFAAVGPMLGELIGRRPTPLRALIAAKAKA